jgi:hypothetical protein
MMHADGRHMRVATNVADSSQSTTKSSHYSHYLLARNGRNGLVLPEDNNWRREICARNIAPPTGTRPSAPYEGRLSSMRSSNLIYSRPGHWLAAGAPLPVAWQHCNPIVGRSIRWYAFGRLALRPGHWSARLSAEARSATLRDHDQGAVRDGS